MNVVGTMFFDNYKLLLDKPRKRKTYQMIGGKVETGETPLMAAIRECREELGPNAKCITPIHFYVFKYKGTLEGTLETSEEIEKFLWYDTSYGAEELSNTLKNEVVPFCLARKLIK